MRASWLSAVIGFAAALGGTAQAQDKVTLRVADVYPAGHYIAEALTKYWMDEATKRSGGALSFQYFPAEQLGKGKDLLALTLSGVTDIGLVIPGFVSDKMPLSAVAELPGGFETACAGTRAYWQLAASGALSEKEFEPNGVRILFATVLPPYQIVLRSKLESLRSFEGQKIYSTGGAKDLTVRRLNAVPVRMSTTEVFESMSRGTIDGGLMSLSTAKAYNLAGLAKYSTIGENFGSGVITYVISKARWNALPDAVRTAMTEAGEAATRRACQVIEDRMSADVEQLKQGGVTLVRLGEADRAEIARQMLGVGRDWAEDLDKRGKSGTAILEAFQAALKAGR